MSETTFWIEKTGGLENLTWEQVSWLKVGLELLEESGEDPDKNESLNDIIEVISKLEENLAP